MLFHQVHLTLPPWVHQAVDAEQLYATDAERIGLAIRLSQLNVERRSGGPFGAAIFNEDGRLVSVGVNRVVPHHCSVAHAEMMAFMTAQARLGFFRLNESGRQYTLATSAQPCSMCYGATIWAGIDRLLIAARASDVETLAGFDEGPLPADWSGELQRRGIEVITDLERDAACAVLAAYRDGGGAEY
ncbi:MAG: nucleoside deaminase [Xanthomonadales bacterium]|jgi:tRNA(Arg) A34 adenosine deaminase TadA|nr:nucleoside deaminase [Xanthomonadales bacterium]